MNKPNEKEDLSRIEQHFLKKDQKRKQKMKVSGSNLKKLGQIIASKAKKKL